MDVVQIVRASLIQERIRAITLQQPFATATVFGPRRIEGRSFECDCGGGGVWLAIHVGKNGAQLKTCEPRARAVWPALPPRADLEAVGGCIIGAVRVSRCVPIASVPAAVAADPWLHLPDTPAFVWMITDVLALPTPVPHTGQQRTWWVETAPTAIIVKAITAHLTSKQQAPQVPVFPQNPQPQPLQLSSRPRTVPPLPLQLVAHATGSAFNHRGGSGSGTSSFSLTAAAAAAAVAAGPSSARSVGSAGGGAAIHSARSVASAPATTATSASASASVRDQGHTGAASEVAGILGSLSTLIRAEWAASTSSSRVPNAALAVQAPRTAGQKRSASDMLASLDSGRSSSGSARSSIGGSTTASPLADLSARPEAEDGLDAASSNQTSAEVEQDVHQPAATKRSRLSAAAARPAPTTSATSAPPPTSAAAARSSYSDAVPAAAPAANGSSTALPTPAPVLAPAPTATALQDAMFIPCSCGCGVAGTGNTGHSSSSNSSSAADANATPTVAPVSVSAITVAHN